MRLLILSLYICFVNCCFLTLIHASAGFVDFAGFANGLAYITGVGVGVLGRTFTGDDATFTIGSGIEDGAFGDG